MALNQTVLQDINKSFEYVYWDIKSIEFCLKQYEIPQLSLCYCWCLNLSSFKTVGEIRSVWTGYKKVLKNILTAASAEPRFKEIVVASLASSLVSYYLGIF